MNNTKLSFAVDASQIDIKPLLQKEFLELSMRAISSANPNRNNSWFTPESMEKSIESFKNKPILGYFENDDFVSHNGEWQEDPETDIAYWDTLNKKGERILGLIRSEDDVQIVKDDSGISWICLTCALWTQYSYKQVKRLLKDAKRAKENGGAAKNISVEVDITDYDMLPNGVMKINEFNLVGITILGSRNGIKVEPGIEDAELSVVDIMGKEFFAKQQQALRVAYERLDNSKIDIEKEDFSQVQTENTEIQNIQGEAVEEKVEQQVEHLEETPSPEENVVDNSQSVSDEIHEQQIEESPKLESDYAEQEQPKEDEEPIQQNENDCEKEEQQEGCDCHEEDHDEEDGEDCEEGCDEDDCECGHNEEEPKEEHFNDIEWLCGQLECTSKSYDSCLEYYNSECYEGENKEYIVNVLSRLSKQHMQGVEQLAGLISNMSCPVAEEESMFEQEVKDFDLHSLYAEYKKVLAEKQELVDKFAAIEKQEFLEQAKLLIASVNGLEEEKANEFYSECESGNINSLEDLKVKVAVAVTFTNNNQEKKVEKTESYSAPVIAPDTKSFSGKAEKTTKSDKWEALHSYIGR